MIVFVLVTGGLLTVTAWLVGEFFAHTRGSGRRRGRALGRRVAERFTGQNW